MSFLIAPEDKTFIYALGPGGTNTFFCQVQSAGPERISKAEKEAVAALMADAPALLGALELLLIGRHYFSAEEGNNRFCKECGQYITDEAHYRDGESRKTDEDKARALIAKHGGGV